MLFLDKFQSPHFQFFLNGIYGTSRHLRAYFQTNIWLFLFFPARVSPHLSLRLDTFASKVAAIQDDTADASVGNVTGSNAVNVFLGIGIAWSMAAIYWWSQGSAFEVNPGS